MNAATLIVFNEMVYGGPAYTAHGLNALLSECSNLTVQAIVTQVSGTSPTLTVTKETACDERNFQTATTLIAGGSSPLTAGVVNVYVGTGKDFAARASRLNITIGGTSSPMAHVKLIVTLRTEFG